MKKGLFVFETGIFNDEIIVAYNLTPEGVLKEIKKQVKRKMLIKDCIPFAENTVKNYREVDPPNKAFVYEERARQILVINKWEDNWEKYETLLHEVVHLVQNIKARKQFNDAETEAYLVEHLFRTIRRRLPIK
jgi:hypothetical protein